MEGLKIKLGLEGVATDTEPPKIKNGVMDVAKILKICKLGMGMQTTEGREALKLYKRKFTDVSESDVPKA